MTHVASDACAEKPETAAKTKQKYNNKLIEFAHANTNAAFDFVQKLSGLKSPLAFVELSTEHVRKQLETLTEQTKQLAALAQNYRRGSALAMAAMAMFLVARAQAEENSLAVSLNEIEPAEVKILSTEFKYAPAKVWVTVGRPVTLVLDNSGAETEHGIVLPAFGFRLMAKAGEITRKIVVFDKPGEFNFTCDLPGHSEAGMKGTLIVSAP